MLIKLTRASIYFHLIYLPQKKQEKETRKSTPIDIQLPVVQTHTERRSNKSSPSVFPCLNNSKFLKTFKKKKDERLVNTFPIINTEKTTQGSIVLKTYSFFNLN